MTSLQTSTSNPTITLPEMITKAQGFKYFVDLNLQNAFHQVPIGPTTRRLLAVQTPWGIFEPQFLPEGVGPASPYLQRIVADIFSDMSDFTITIFDNILMRAHPSRTLRQLRKSYQQMYPT